MMHRVSTGFGWVDASVSRSGDQWVATLTDHHTSLGGVGPGAGQTPEEALGDLSAAIGRLCSTRKHATPSRPAVRAGGSVVAGAVRAFRRVIGLHGNAVHNAAVAVASDTRARRQRESVRRDVTALTRRSSRSGTRPEHGQSHLH